ncbi:Conidiophore development regulator abaA [Psilocybe cubensis]|uniref:Conidiophore development regulator abaA n=2 Tax=Psilocybe cubensis TaxID=181762 RepID=A0ACB8H9X5_PSICU|nr:Conidiophore development regulator abaA [Psilocybe cubensis]KAH9484301.1 Conidiophore development regulator abaA [Psilocybe cubensis]
MTSSRASSSAIKKHDNSPPSITPQRKHRKLLKDGSGTEVWPESIEKVFVQGLREYWDSPYATYSQSRGRSRWRNQFLVDYLAKQGIDRSKKQVASHIQVLRNMWKGEPEFHLVAGGDELYPEGDSPMAAPVKLEEYHDSNSLIPFEWDESDHLPSSNSVSPNFSPADSQSEFPPTPEQRPGHFPPEFGVIHPKLQGMPLDLSYAGHGLNSPSISPSGDFIQQLPHYGDASSPFAAQQAKYPAAPPVIQIPPSYQSRKTPTDPSSQTVMSATPTHYRYARNKVTSVFLQADGMTPFSVKVDALSHPQGLQPPLTLRVRLCVPTMNDARTPSTFHGFQSFVSLENVWSATSRCVTKVYGNNICISEETGYLNVTHINVGTVNAGLPESSLNRCRWLDASLSIVLTQEIIVDDETLLCMIYDLDRKSGPMPSATLLGFHKYRAADKGTPPTTASISPSPSTNLSFPHAGPYARPTSQPSLSYALTPTRYQ